MICINFNLYFGGSVINRQKNGMKRCGYRNKRRSIVDAFKCKYPPDCKVKSHNGADLRIFFSRQHNTITVLKMPFFFIK